MEQNLLSNKKYTVNVIDAKVVNKRLFSFKYVEFTLETVELKWKVGRRFSDFELLFEILKKMFPCYFVPRLLHTKKGSRFNPNNIEKRRKYFQKIMDDLVASPVLSQSMPLFYFLSIETSSELTKKFNEYKKESASNKLQLLQTLSGQATIKYGEKEEKKCENVGKFILSSSTHYLKYIIHQYH